ncbi:MAG: 2,5-diamino-6-(ribosylamino)-4(3H)-pyrimidinone 5'-phosphate reductase [Thermoplasmatales archaeon]|nr:2,5-diamino-6-(ribosylamino)-4(3H)-pyrimidinone 5'-phosphate reductase [Thermoplasmatales archaeon]
MRVIINCAMSADGKIALPSRVQIKISNEDDMKRVHLLRNECDAVLVGINTILSDNPKLTVKEKYVKNPKNPLRVVVDSKCRTPGNANVLDRSAETLVVVAEGFSKQMGDAEVVECGKGRIDLKKLLKILEKKGVKKLLVEGGSTVIWSFLNEKLADELMVFVGPAVIGGKGSLTLAGGEGAKCFEEIIPLKLIDVKRIGDGVLLHYRVVK